MKLLSPLTLGTIAIGVGITGYTLLSGEEKELQSNNTPSSTLTTSQIQQQSQKSMWEILDEATKRANNSQLTVPTEREALIDFVNKNPNLKIRIQGMGWHRDILSGKTPLDTPFNGARDMIRDAALIEDELMKNSSLIHQLQKSREWQAYRRGESPPNNIIYGEIRAFGVLQDFEKRFPEEFQKITKNPLFISNEKGESATFGEQESVMQVIMNNVEYLKKNPAIMDKLSQYGYSMNDFYTSRWDTESNIYRDRDFIVGLEEASKNTFPEVWRQFWWSETGILYRAGKVTPREAANYLNELSIQYAP